MDSACSVEQWSDDPKGNQRRIAETFREACAIAEDHGERLAAEGEICWGGMHSWRRMIELLEMVDRRQTLGFQADMSHTLLYLLGYNAPGRRTAPADFDWRDRGRFDAAYAKLTAALRPWTIDFHVAQNDGSVYGAGSHDKTGRHCLATDPGGKLDIVHHAGFWLRDDRRPAHAGHSPYLLGRLHVSQRRADEAGDVERRAPRDGGGEGRARVGREVKKVQGSIAALWAGLTRSKFWLRCHRPSPRSSPGGRREIAVRQDAFNGLIVGDRALLECGGEAGVGREARVGVDFQNPRLPGLIDAEIDPHPAAKIKALPTPSRQAAKFVQQRRIAGFVVEAAGRVVIFELVVAPFRAVTDDPRLAGGKGRKVDLGRQEDLRLGAVRPGEHGDGEFAAVDELLGEAGPARPRSPLVQPLRTSAGLTSRNTASSPMSREPCSQTPLRIQAGPKGRPISRAKWDSPPRSRAKGQAPFVRSTLRAFPANGACPLFRRSMQASAGQPIASALWPAACAS